jgi:tryptophan synthase beta chain
LFDIGRAQFVAVEDEDAMKAGIELSRTEGIIPAIETAHAIHSLQQIDYKSDDVIVINLSGRGDKDLDTYIKWGGY